jgi:hypothetical protein
MLIALKGYNVNNPDPALYHA